MNTKRGQRLLLTVAVLLALGLVLSITTAAILAAKNSTEANERGQERESQVERNDETLALIKDCTQPDGECFKRGQRRTAAAVGDINEVVILAASCASGPVRKSVEQIQSCVIARLAADDN